MDDHVVMVVIDVVGLAEIGGQIVELDRGRVGLVAPRPVRDGGDTQQAINLIVAGRRVEKVMACCYQFLVVSAIQLLREQVD